jgi:prophage antirepressor-like protein
MNALTIFDFQDKEIRTITDNVGNPWFAGMDVAETLGYADTDDAIRRLTHRN